MSHPLDQPPRLPYNGLTILVSHPSRFDTHSLFTGNALNLVSGPLSPLVLQACDVKVLQEDLYFLPGTRVLLCLGEFSAKRFTSAAHQDLSLNQLRGCPEEYGDKIMLSSYLPQDALDMRASYEANYNQYIQQNESDSNDSSNDHEDEGGEKSTKGATQRRNYRFWLKQDIAKARRILQATRSGIPFSSLVGPVPTLRTYESSEEICRAIKAAEKEVYLDIENDPLLQITVFSLSFDDSSEVWVIPFMSYDYSQTYSTLDMAKILRELFFAFRRLTVVIHNSSYDLFVLAARYRLAPPRRIFDTMLVHSRLHPGTEKSLGHCISLYTYLRYHKNEGVFQPQTRSQEQQLWEYNAQDVWSMKLVKRGQLLAAKELKAEGSIEQINRSQYSYLLMTLLGVAIHQSGLTSRIQENDRRMTQFLRVTKCLRGSDLLPTSNKQCVNYFHHELKLPVINRSVKTGQPSLSADNMYKLYMKNDHPMIPVVMEYRRVSKETSDLTFKYWREQNARDTTTNLNS